MNKNIVVSLMLLQSLSMISSFDNKVRDLRIDTTTPFSVVESFSPMPEGTRLNTTPRPNKTQVRADSPLMKENRPRALSGLGQSLEDEVFQLEQNNCVEFTEFCFVTIKSPIAAHSGLISYIATKDNPKLIPAIRATWKDNKVLDKDFVAAIDREFLSAIDEARKLTSR